MVCQGQGPRATPSKRLPVSECPMTSRDWQREGWRGWLGPWRSDAGDPAIACDAVQITTLGLSRGLPQQRDRWENMNEVSDYSWWDEYKEICFCSVNFSAVHPLARMKLSILPLRQSNLGKSGVSSREFVRLYGHVFMPSSAHVGWQGYSINRLIYRVTPIPAVCGRFGEFSILGSNPCIPV